MGLKTSNGGGTYIRFKEGKFFRSNDKDQLFTEIEGEIIGINLANDEYEGKPIKKLVIKMTDGEENFILSLSFDSSYASNLIGFLKNADLSKPLSLVGTFKEGKDGKRNPGILVKQDEKFMKAFYTKDAPNGLPPMVQKRNGKWDKDDMSEFLENVVLEELAPSVSNTKPSQNRALTKETPKERIPVNEVDEDGEDDDMPF